jgi:hypothetical protein
LGFAVHCAGEVSPKAGFVALQHLYSPPPPPYFSSYVCSFAGVISFRAGLYMFFRVVYA